MRVKVDVKGVPEKIRKFREMGQKVLDEQILKDSNKYAPEDTGELIRSSIRSTRFGSGRIIWDTPYARRLYYNPQYNFSKDKNPNAGGLWFRRARARHLNQWKKMLEQLKKKYI
jgi:hypothetical protein